MEAMQDKVDITHKFGVKIDFFYNSEQWSSTCINEPISVLQQTSRLSAN